MARKAIAALRRRAASVGGVAMIALGALAIGTDGRAAGDADKPVDNIKTASPIKHVIIIVGENRSFDHVFATFKPKTPGETVANLLSKKIINADGSPGPNFALAHQFKIVAPPNSDKYFVSASQSQKMLYQVLPAPDLAGTPPVSPLAFILSVPGGDPACRQRTNSCSRPEAAGLACRHPSSVRTRALLTSAPCPRVPSR